MKRFIVIFNLLTNFIDTERNNSGRVTTWLYKISWRFVSKYEGGKSILSFDCTNLIPKLGSNKVVKYEAISFDTFFSTRKQSINIC